MLNTMLTVVAKITKKFWLTCGIPMATADLGSDSDIEPNSDMGLSVLTWSLLM